MYPTKEQAHALLHEGGGMNPGPWIPHSCAVAQCAEKIAGRCGMDPDKAYVLGLLHDIGRRYGVTAFRHAIDGHRFLLELGYGEAARICLTHMISTRSLDDHVGQLDITDDEETVMRQFITETEFDDYDLLIQLCDTLAGAEVVGIQARLVDVERRYGKLSRARHDRAAATKAYFEEKCGANIYTIVTDDKTLWGE